ncbi:hypothetical protein [Brevibacillus laterosporus]|uniref:Uncharacterized protein n=1 Tax=Brevibacillus laterosporus TaxID=1465 RepID=A0AAP8QGR9_BRELA|nr:hypothetical protein [Brevibacillus laterosporus]MBG9776204.1 hypothetical protein [Brevibacillus laterosporus]PPB12828.1 hypothetical protein C4A77_00140 [Brevibacillus laterosporus]
MAKRMTLNDLNKEHKKISGQKVIHILNGQYEVKIDEHIRESKLFDMLSDIGQLLSPLASDNSVTPEDLALATQLSNVLFLRSFTDLPIPKENDLSTLTKVYIALFDTGILEEVTEKFNEKDMQKVKEKVVQYFKNAPQVENMIGQIYSSMLQDDEIEKVQKSS